MAATAAQLAKIGTYTSAADTGGRFVSRFFDRIGNRRRERRDKEYNKQAAASAREFSSHEAQLGRDFTERMSNTAYRRSAADMTAAGLNPMMMYGGGAGAQANTPGASAASSGMEQASTSEPRLTQPSSALAETIMQKAQLALQAKSIEAEIKLKGEKEKTERTVQKKNLQSDKSKLGQLASQVENLKFLYKSNPILQKIYKSSAQFVRKHISKPKKKRKDKK